MKTRDIAMMGMGAAALMMYQKYNKPVMKKMDHAMDKTMKTIDKTMKKANNKLEDMM